MSGAVERARRFVELHQGPELFVMGNPFNVGSALKLQDLGYQALGTSSAAVAYDLGLRDGAGDITREIALDHAREIAAATTIPVSGDFENGFGDTPDDVRETVRAAVEAGLAGCCIEDSTSTERGPIYDAGLAAERIAAGAEAVGDAPFVFVARAENYLHGRRDLADTIARLQSFEAAGATAVYAPGLADLGEIGSVVESVGVPVNVLAGIPGQHFTLDDLARVGVRRVSVGSNFWRVANQAFVDNAQQLLGEPVQLAAHFGR